MSHYIDNKKIVFNNSLILNDGKAVDDYILVSDANGAVRWDTTTNYVSIKEFDHFVGEWFGGGVVVAVWKEGSLEKCLVAAPQDCSFVGTQRFSDTWPPVYLNYPFLGFEVPWSNVDLTSGASYSVSGLSNSNIVVAQPGFSTTINPFQNYETDTLSGYSGAAQYALNYINPDLGTGVFNDWYLPAAHEIITLWNNASAVNRALAEYADYNSVSTSPNFGAQVNSQINLFGLNADNGGSGYWTSTEASATEAYYLSNNGSILKAIKKEPAFTADLSKFKRVRPFRIASDNQVSFKFDAEYIIITYKYTDGQDLDTRTRMISPSQSQVASITPYTETLPYNPGVNGSPFSSNWIGHTSQAPWSNQTKAMSFTPGATTSTSPPAGYYSLPQTGNNPNGTFSILWHAGDNTGLGSDPNAYETVLINVQAFKFHYPGQSIIRIDCRAMWWAVLGTGPVVLGVDLYKGGNPQRFGPVFNSGYIWENPAAAAKLSLDSISTTVTAFSGQQTGKTPDGLQDSDRVAIVEYNLVSKTGKIIK